MTLVFGGPTWPIAWGVGYLARPYDDVRTALRDWLDELERRARWTELAGDTLVDKLFRLAPIQAPWTRHLLVRTAGGWTACFDNWLLGGDQASWVGYLSRRLDCEAVIAAHIPIGQYPYPATQFELLGPRGKPPLRYLRTISAGIFDEGRWRFDVSGEPQPFEQTERYTARRIRDRFTRDMLVRYLAALGIGADESSFYNDGVLVEELVSWKCRSMSIEEARRAYAKTRG